MHTLSCCPTLGNSSRQLRSHCPGNKTSVGTIVPTFPVTDRVHRLRPRLHACAAVRPGQVPYEPHMLDAASSPLISALPQYERSFQDHFSSGHAYLVAMQVSLVSPMSGRMDASREVQGYRARPLIMGPHSPTGRCLCEACWWLARRMVHVRNASH